MCETSVGTGAAKGAGGLRAFNRIGCLGLIALALALPVIGYFEAVREAEADLAALKKELAAEGILVPIEELIPKVPKGEGNAADLYQQAFGTFQISETEQNIVESGPRSSPERTKLLSLLVARNEPYYDLLDEAAALPYCAFPFDWGDFLAGPQHYAPLREVARKLALRTEALARGGRSDAALDSVATGLRLAEHIEAEPKLISQMVTWAVQSICLPSSQDLLDVMQPTPAACRRLYEELARLDHTSAFVNGLKAELAVDNPQYFEMLRKEMRGKAVLSRDPMLPDFPMGPAPSVGDEVVVRSYGTLGKALAYRDEANSLRLKAAAVAAAALPWAQARQRLADAASRLASSARWESVGTRMSLGPGFYLRLVASRTKHEADVALFQIALAAKAFHYSQGRYPESLAELQHEGWDLPKDPFTGKALHYRREGQGFVVWSLGPNMRDDNAVKYDSETMPYTDGPYDIVLRLKR